MAFASRPGPRVRAHLSRHFLVEPGLDEFLELKVKTPDESQGSPFFGECGSWNNGPSMPLDPFICKPNAILSTNVVIS